MVPGATAISPWPHRDRVRVAFMVGEHADVIDTTGPCEVFQDVASNDFGRGLHTVAPKTDRLEMTGGPLAKPDCSIDDAPRLHVIVVPAHMSTTHHRFFDRFAKEFPDVELRRGLRFADSGRIATAACMEFTSDARRG